MVTYHAGTLIRKLPLLLLPKGQDDRRYMGGGTRGLSSKTSGFRIGDLSREEREYEGGARGEPGLGGPSPLGDEDRPGDPCPLPGL